MPQGLLASLPEDELFEWRFVETDALEQCFPDFTVRRLRVAHECALDGTMADLEFGYRPE